MNQRDSTLERLRSFKKKKKTTRDNAVFYQVRNFRIVVRLQSGRGSSHWKQPTGMLFMPLLSHHGSYGDSLQYLIQRWCAAPLLRAKWMTDCRSWGQVSVIGGRGVAGAGAGAVGSRQLSRRGWGQPRLTAAGGGRRQAAADTACLSAHLACKSRPSTPRESGVGLLTCTQWCLLAGSHLGFDFKRTLHLARKWHIFYFLCSTLV